ncbi:hypothetical protein N7492_009915 [Penicillium capsulatum]|uniref:Enoyl reductase (ER) domain-containing protein n=1 Tax=Penicillium capsulatum TaxID=69766 RepID=A0A9W9HMR9_9EURO|nr:hypothetical protein N7492_009915 [Penicillium capsulatum]KAJ6112426.1 hypothetical protein N7512_007750 [Penicillium capsulatum]
MPQAKTQSGIIMTSRGKAQVQHDLTIPSPDDGQILVKTKALALNPPDWMALDAFGRPGAGMGFDFAGEVVEAGEGVNSLVVGNRVAGFVHACHGANYSVGAFREFLLADADLTLHIPDSLPFAEASTLGMGVSTAAQALYQTLQLPLPGDATPTSSGTILVYGGSTATGTLAVQFAELSGMRVITACSQRNIAWMRSLGADEVVDHNDPNAINIITSKAGHDGLSLIMDCVAQDKTAEFCYQCFKAPSNSRDGAMKFRYAPLMPIRIPPSTPDSLPSSTRIQSEWRMVYTCFGRRFTMVHDGLGISQTWEASKEDKRFMVDFYRQVEKALADGRLKPMPIEVQEGGLESILDGVSKVRQGGARGKKLVYVF